MYEIFEQLLQKMGVTVYKVSKDTGIAQSTFSSWKAKNSKIGTENAEILAKYFGVSIDYLMGREKEKESDIELSSEEWKRLRLIKISPDIQALVDTAADLEKSDIDFIIEMAKKMKK